MRFFGKVRVTPGLICYPAIACFIFCCHFVLFYIKRVAIIATKEMMATKIKMALELSSTVMIQRFCIKKWGTNRLVKSSGKE
jgi:hypothetical protein